MTTARPHAITPAPNVVLTGFMGTGKTTVGRLLAERLRRQFVDTDEIIEERFGPIPKIFEDLGEAAFRDMERDVATWLASTSDLVIGTGGRLMLDDQAGGALAATGKVFCLAADVETLISRLADEADGRPLLAGDDATDRIRALIEERREAYGRFDQVETADRTPEQVADDIIGRL